MNKSYGFVSALVLLVLLSACGSRGPLRSYQKGEELAYYDFTSSDQFEQGTYSTASLLIRDGKFRIDVREGDNELWWGQWGEIYDNTVIEVDTEQLSERPENAYGVMCRVRGRVGQTVNPEDLSTPEALPDLEATAGATEANQDATSEAAVTEAADGNSGGATEIADETATGDEEATEAADEATETAETGAEDATEAADEATDTAVQNVTEEVTEAADEAATAEATPEALPATMLEASNGDGYLFLIQGGGSYGIFRARGRDLSTLVDWQISDAINPGPAQNHLRVVCMNDYLALYVNDQLVAETTDDSYQRGQIGLVASAASRLGAVIEFDNLAVSEANAG